MLPRAGIGLRAVHHEAVAETRPDIGWFEIHAENYLGGGSPVQTLDAVRRDYPVALHGVGLSLGSAQGLDDGHLDRVAALAERIEPFLVSEHLSWSVVDGRYLNDLLPLPYTRETLDIVAANVGRLQDRLKRRILVENPSTYLRFRASEMTEWEFLRALVRRSGCGLLCDVNNIHVSACNHGFDASAYLAALPAEAVGELHLAGHAVNEADGIAILIDDHGSPVGDAVWRLFDRAVALFPSAPALVEWDSNIPPLERLVAEAWEADRRRAQTARALRSEPVPTRARVA
ncbi:MAG: DUF692 domain-containing protein [Alphaproteobacteria bacterium]|nr:DUF692 domain-containing protein [Alphaproteobacteria bacterium]